MRHNLLIRPIAASWSQIHPAGSRRRFLRIPVAGLLFGSGLVVACFGLAGAIVSYFQAGESGEWLANEGPWPLFTLLGMTVVWRYKPRRFVDRFKSSREVLKHTRIVHCESFPNPAAKEP
jgi:hypothetical protein